MKSPKFSVLVLGLIVIYFILYRYVDIGKFDNKIYDLSLSAVKKIDDKKYDSSVVIVDIDEKSLKYVGQWPWSRLLLSKMLSNIINAYPSNIGLDILFPEKDKTSIVEIKRFFKRFFSKNIQIKGIGNNLTDNDKIFANILKVGSVTLPVYMTNEVKDHCYLPQKNRSELQIEADITPYKTDYMLCNIDILQRAASDVGFINIESDSDGILRRAPMFIGYKNGYVPSFVLANLMNLDTLKVDANKTVSILGHTFKTDEKSNILLNYQEGMNHKVISAVDVLSKNFKNSFFRGKFVLIGASAIGLHDHYTLSNSKVVPGVYAQASLMDEILHDKTIYQPQKLKYASFAISFLLSLLMLFLSYKKCYIKVFLLFLVSLCIYVLISVFLLDRGVYDSLGYFVLPHFILFFIVNIGSLIWYYQERRYFLQELSKAHSDTIDSMSLVAETRDSDTGAHIFRTKEYMRFLSDYLYKHNIYKEELSGNFRELVYRAAPLHDIGKVGIPDNILKKPGSLTDEEYEIMKTHSIIGKQIIENAMKNNKDNRFLQIAYNIAYYHHEKWDGSGYPCGLKKDEIPLEARMMALVDVYDALISRRYYKSSFSYDESDDIIIKGSGTHFDPILVAAFVETRYKFRQIAEKIK